MSGAKRLGFLVAASIAGVGVVGCADPPKPLPEPARDQCLRQAILLQCLSVSGLPERSHYSDADEVVESCGQQAYWISTRSDAGAIAPECRAP